MNRKVAVGMLRQGRIGSQVLEILNVVVDDIRDSICEAEGIANCPENEDEIRAKMILVWVIFSFLLRPSTPLTSVFIMSLNRQIVLGLLRRGNDGNSILEILDLIVKEYQEQQSTKNQPTLDPIAF